MSTFVWTSLVECTPKRGWRESPIPSIGEIEVAPHWNQAVNHD